MRAQRKRETLSEHNTPCEVDDDISDVSSNIKEKNRKKPIYTDRNLKDEMRYDFTGNKTEQEKTEQFLKEKYGKEKAYDRGHCQQAVN